MFILIFEDGSLKQTNDIDNGDLHCADEGILDIIDISEPMPRQYFDKGWHPIEDA